MLCCGLQNDLSELFMLLHFLEPERFASLGGCLHPCTHPVDAQTLEAWRGLLVGAAAQAQL